MKLLKKALCFILFSSTMFGFEIYVRDMVGKSTNYAHTTVPLPSVVKANSDWVPLCKIDVTTNTGSGLYVLTGVTVTIRNVSNFDFFNDISDVKIFIDDKSGNYTTASTTTWDTAVKENLLNIEYTNVSSGTFLGTSFWKVYWKIDVSSNVDMGSNSNRWYTIYICIKTSENIQNGTAFALRNNSSDIILDINGNIQTPTLPSFTTLTADTIPPQLQTAYTLNPTNGTSLTVYNYDTYNIYTTTTDAGNPYANNNINVKIKLSEDSNSLSNNGVVPLYNLILLDTSEIDGNNPVNIKSISYLGSNEFRIDYTIIQTTVNSPTVAVPFKIKVRDAAGNETSWDDSFRVFIDRTKPSQPVITSPLAGSWIKEEFPTLSWQAVNEDNLLGYYLVFSTCNIVDDWIVNNDRGYRWVENRLYDIFGSSWEWTNNYPNAGTDTYYWAVAAVDKAGNISTSLPNSFKFDNINPHAYNLTPQPGLVLNFSTPTISIDVDDVYNGNTLSGIDFITTKFIVNGQEVVFSTAEVNTTTTTLKYTPSFLSDGQNNVSVQVYDKVGNNVTHNWTFYIDTTKPESKDTDNDGYSDQDELLSGTNPNDPFSYPTKQKGFWPLQNTVVSTNWVNGGSTITLRLDEIKVNNFASGLDISYTTSSINKIVVTHLTKGTTENWVYLPSSSWVGSSSATICIQLARPFATNGSDDGEIQIKYQIKDNAGNTTDWITRKFYYDTTPPIISTISVPSQTGSETQTEFVISVNDNIAVDESAGSVQLGIWINGTLSWYSMEKQSGNRWLITKTFSGISGTIRYCFKAKDKIGYTTVYPPSADIDETYAIPLVITDQTPPKTTIYQIRTLQNYNVIGLTTTYTSTGTDATGIKTSVPIIYQAPNNETIYNIISATVPAEAQSVNLEFKLSTATQWSFLSCTKTSKVVSGNPVWEVDFNAISLPTDKYYDIRIVATDANGNTYVPTEMDTGYARIYLASPLQPKTKIDTANQLIVKDGNTVNNKKLLLNAITVGNNLDISSVKFQYKKSTENIWHDIGTDDLTKGVTVTFVLKSAEFPYLEYLNSVKITSVTSVVLDFTSGVNYDNYDKTMTKTGDGWFTTVYFVNIGTYTYRYKIVTPEGEKYFTLYDPRRYINAAFNQIPVSKFAVEWDLSTLPYGEYTIRAVAKDRFGIEDITPETISLYYVSSKPGKPIITSPLNGEKFKPNSTVRISASILQTDIYVTSMLFQYSEDGKNWINYSLDTNKSDGWSCNFTVPNTLANKFYYFRCIAYTTPPDNSEYSDVVYIEVDAQAPQVLSFTVLDGTSSVVILQSGKTYTLKVETLDNDISTVSFTLSGISGVVSPNNGVINMKSGGSGTTDEPYYYLCSYLPNNINNTYGSINVTLYDTAGNSVSKSVNVQVIDVTPSIATILRYSNDSGTTWVYPTDETFAYFGRNPVVINVNVSNVDGGTVKLQYSSSTTSGWITIGEQPSSSSLYFYWSPFASGIPEGVYYLRAVAVDNDNNVDPAPQVVKVKLDYKIPKISLLTVSLQDTVDCSGEFTIYAKTDDTDVKNITIQYLNPATNNWVQISETTQLIKLVSSNITPNAAGLNEASWVCIADGLSSPTTIKIRAYAVDRANNFSYEPEYSPQINVKFNDTTPPVASVYNINTADVYALTSDANIKSVLFQYRAAGSTNTWVDLGTTYSPAIVFGNVGKIWKSPASLSNLPSGTYEIRAIATDMFNNVDISKAPIITVVIQVNTTGTKSYNVGKLTKIYFGLKDTKFDSAGGVELSFEVKSDELFVSPPVINLLIDDGVNSITKVIQTTINEEGSYIGIIKLDNISRSQQNSKIWMSVQATTTSGIYSETKQMIITSPSTAISISSIDDGFIRNVSLNNLSKPACLIISPKIQHNVPEIQSELLKPVGRCYEFKLSDNTKQFPSGVTATITMVYTDADITNVDETKLGVAYWDEERKIWSAEGISNVRLNTVSNEITFNTNHFSAFAIMEINSLPEIIIESPKENGIASANPLISIKSVDKFSGIAEIKIIIDGKDYTYTAIDIASSDGIDNNLDGRIDEQGGTYDNFDDEQPFNIISPTAARFVTRLPLNLKDGTHTLTVVARNQQGQTTTKTVMFNVSSKLDFAGEPYNYPNPFNPRKTETTIVPNITKDADVTVNIYDFAGDKVATLGPVKIYGSGTGPNNVIRWNGTEEKTKKYLADGVYFAEIVANDGSQSVRKFVKIAITSKE